MTYRDTARAFADAEEVGNTAAAAILPLSEWAESRRDLMTPQTIAANHALHVSNAAYDLREAVNAWENPEAEHTPTDEELASVARALLAAIGESA